MANLVSLKLQAALAAVAASPILSHMRKTAYQPVLYNSREKSAAESLIALNKAQEKRNRKNAKRTSPSMASSKGY